MDTGKIAKALFNKFAQPYQDKFMDAETYVDTYTAFCDRVQPKEAAILEVACGPGNITRHLLAQRPDFKLLGIDLAEKMIDLARINNPDAEFRVMDGRNIGELNQQFDGILCGFGLPYLSQEEVLLFIREASQLLRPSGVLYLSTMEDDYSKSGFKGSSSGGSDQLYTYYYKADFLTESLHQNDLTLIDLQRRPYPESDGSITTDLFLLAQK